MSFPSEEVRPEDFQAAGDGDTNDQSAFDQATAYLAQVSGPRVLHLTAGRWYRVGTTDGSPAVKLPPNTTIRGVKGWGLSTTANAPILDLSAGGCSALNFTLTGTSSGANQHAVVFGKPGIAGSGASDTLVIGLHAKWIAGKGFYFPATSDHAHIGPQLIGCKAENCFTAGISVEGQEDITVTNFVAYGCTTGLYLESGNFKWVGGTANLNTVGVHIAVDPNGNDGHGTISSVHINHSTEMAVRVGAIVNGFDFADCNIYYPDHSATVEQGIYLQGSRGVTFSGGKIDVGDIYLDGCVGARFNNVGWPMSCPNNVHDNYNNNPSTSFWINNRKLDGLPFRSDSLNFPLVAQNQRPAATAANAGFPIFNIDANQIQVSDGTNWRDGNGNIV